MTPEQLEAIKARNEARTPGKWNHTTYLSGTQNVEFPGSRGVAVVDAVNDSDGKPISDSVLCLPPTHVDVSHRLEDYGKEDDHQRFHNGQFIAHASEDIPDLLAEVARLQSALEEAEKLFKRIEGEAKAGHAYAMQGQQPHLPSAEAIKFSSIMQIAGERKGPSAMVKP